MKRHTNQMLQIDDRSIDDDIAVCQFHVEQLHGKSFSSVHELYAILKEEVDEFWDSIKAKDPNPEELLDIIVVARMGLLWLCEQARNEVEEMKREQNAK